MKNKSFTDKIIKRFYGISEPLDEYKRQEADKMGNLAFIFLFFVILIGNVFDFALADTYPKIVAYAYPTSLMVIVLIISGFIVWKSAKTRLTDLDTQLMSPKEKKDLKYAPLKTALLSGFLFHLLFSLMQSGFNLNLMFVEFFKVQRIIASLFYGIFMGIAFKITLSRRQARFEEDEDDD